MNKKGEKITIEKNTRKATWKNKILKNKSKDSNFRLIFFSSARPKQLQREEKGRLTDVSHNSWWHKKSAQHTIYNPKSEKMRLFTTCGGTWKD